MKFINKNYIALAICIMVVGCKAPSAVESAAKTVVPEAFSTTDTYYCKYAVEKFLY
jgi:hypothetical protein